MKSLWLHAVDILLGTLVLRAILGWLAANPRVMKLLVPIVVAALMLLFNVYAELPLLTLLVLFVATPIAILLLVSALGEMRGFFETATVRAMFSFGRKEPNTVLPELARTLRQLSQERVGALIVMPRHDDLHRLLTGGEPYDAKFTRSLLLSIFNPESPRHDGALVLQNDRVTRVGAVLPLASGEGAREEWGTRHLAAVGLSENCDADILVVSEERGTVSHAHAGRLTVLESESDDALTASLENAVGSSGPSDDHPLRGRRRALLMWVLALTISIVVSFNVNRVASRLFGEPSLITSREVPINLINIPKGLYVDALSAGKCELLVQVPQNSFVMGESNWPVVVDLAEYKPGPARVTLERDLIPKMPREWVVYSFNPKSITFTLVKARQADVGITPKFEGLAETLRVVKSSTAPPTLAVEIRDPKWRESQRLETHPIDLSKIEAPGDYTLKAWLNLPTTVTPVEPDAKSYEVEVSVTVESK